MAALNASDDDQPVVESVGCQSRSETGGPSQRPLRASLIVVNFNGREVLRSCLDSLLDSIDSTDEIIVVDNNSSDGSLALVPDSDQIRVLCRDNNSFIHGLNDGVKAALGRYVAFLNNDTLAAPDFVDRCLDRFDSPDVFAVCPRVLNMCGQDQGSLTSGRLWRGMWYYDVHEHDASADNTFFAVGGQSFFDATKIADIGPVDPLLRPMYHEDIELSLRAWLSGYSIRFAPDAIIYHVGGHTSNRVFTAAELRSFVRQNQFLTAWKLLSFTELLYGHIPYIPLRLGLALLRRDWPTLHGFAGALRRVPELSEPRRTAKTLRHLGTGEVRSRVAPAGLGIRTSVVG